MKTNFIDGTPITPALMNALNNPVYKANPSKDGEIPLPPSFSAIGSYPKQNFCNSSCRGSSEEGFSTWDFSTYTIDTIGLRSESSAAGFSVKKSSTYTEMGGIVVANSVGDIDRGFYIWNASGSAPTIGKKIGILVDPMFIKNSGLTSKTDSDFEEYETTYQLEVKNNASAGGVSSFSVSINVDGESDLVSSGRIEIIDDSGIVSIAPGGSAVLWKRIRVKQNKVGSSSNPISPLISFQLVTAGNFRIDILGLGVFSGNSFGVKIPVDSDSEFAKIFRKNLGPFSRAHGYTKKKIVPVIWDYVLSRIYGYINVPLRNKCSLSSAVLSVSGAEIWRRTSVIDATPNVDTDVTSSATYEFIGLSGDGSEAIIKVSAPGGSYGPSSLSVGEIYLMDFTGSISLEPS